MEVNLMNNARSDLGNNPKNIEKNNQWKKWKKIFLTPLWGKDKIQRWPKSPMFFLHTFSKKNPPRSQKGIALLTAVTALALMTYIAIEVTYDTQVEYLVNSQNLNRLKAYYAARSGVEISLLRIKIYQTLLEKLGKNLPTDGTVDQIWKFPLIWPLVIPDGLNEVDKGQIKEKTNESLLDSQFITSITDEGSKIDLSQLASPSDTLVQVTKKQILALFENKKKNDEEFARVHADFNFEGLVNSIIDWMSSKNQSLNGGDKRTSYRSLGTDEYPPNRNFRTLQELRLVTGMTDEFYQILEPQVTIYGQKGINPNSASREVIMTIDPSITKEIADEVITHRQDPQQGPFKDANAFFDFLEQKGARLTINRQEFPIVTDSYTSFRIKSIGEYNGAKRVIEVITIDTSRVADNLSAIQKKEDEKKNPTASNPDSTNDPNKPPPGTASAPGTPGADANKTSTSTNSSVGKGPPRIIYWNEF